MSQPFTLFFPMLLLAAWPARGAEVRLRPECRPAGPLVLLGDVAEIYAQDDAQAKKLAGVELFPTPGAGQRRFLRVRETLEILELRSVDLTECRIVGTSLTVVHGPPAPMAARSPAPKEAPPPPVRENETQPVVLAVAAARPVERGQVIQPADVQLVAFPAPAARDNLLHEIALAVGQEATRRFGPGQPIDPRGLRRPLWVRRREGVRITVLAPGVRLTTDGVAMEDGAHGEWVLIETGPSKERVRARVSGPRQVEVYSGGAAP